MRKVIKFIFALIICQLAGIIGSFFTTPNIDTWYAFLNKPPLNPPSWLFGPVWIILYFLMGIAFYLIWQKGFKKKKVKTAMIIFLVHLLFNAIWSIVFFGWHQVGLALINIIIIWLFIIVLFKQFIGINKLAAYLLIPYFLWVSFATYLNVTILILN